MLFAWLPILVLTTTPAVQNEGEISIAPHGREFVLRSGSKSDRVPLSPPAPRMPKPWPTEKVLFRKDAAFAVWDSRGLSVRQRSWVFTSQLTEIALTPKLFSKEEIEVTKRLLAEGKRRLAASGVVGAMRDGAVVYFLAQWRETDGRPWLEALVKVDLSDPKPKPQLVGKFGGMSLDLRPGKSRLFVRDERPCIWSKSETTWGLESFDPDTNVFDLKPVGGKADTIELGAGRIGWFVERTEHPSRILGRWDSVTLNRRDLVETRGTIRLLADRPPWIAVIHEDEGAVLQNLESGGRFLLPDSAGFDWCAFGVLVWTPREKPAKAVLYEPSRWAELSRWTAPYNSIPR